MYNKFSKFPHIKVKRSRIYFSLVILLISLISLSCSGSLENLDTSKAAISFYYESGQYNNELAEIIKNAIEDFRGIIPSDSSVVIFDVDETALSNYEHIKETGFGYVPELWNEWVLSSKAPAIEEVKDLYNRLLLRRFRIIFLTGRNSGQYDATYKNLINAGYTKFDTLIVRSDELKDAPAFNFKNIERLVLKNLGYKIAGCVGDQNSDIEGENTGLKVKLPNYMYIVE